jgi:beta-fructofuranosidase
VETFVQGGRTVITSRVYPEHALDDAAHVFLFNNGTAPITASATIWNMNTVHITEFT